MSTSDGFRFDAASPVDEPMEVRLDADHGQRQTARPRVYVLAFWRYDNGMLGHSLSLNGDGVAESLSNLQAKAVWPRKAVPGWQAEVLAVVATGLYKVVEVR